MKAYKKPHISFECITNQAEISSLNQWLSQNGLEGAGITTYTIYP